jgi:hypothetical protein
VQFTVLPIQLDSATVYGISAVSRQVASSLLRKNYLLLLLVLLGGRLGVEISDAQQTVVATTDVARRGRDRAHRTRRIGAIGPDQRLARMANGGLLHLGDEEALHQRLGPRGGVHRQRVAVRRHLVGVNAGAGSARHRDREATLPINC